HRFAFGSRVAVRQRDRDFLVGAENDFRRVVAAVVDQRVMQPAERGTRIDGHVLDFERFQKIDDDIRSPLGPRLFNFLCFRHERIPFSVYNAILRAKNTIRPASTGKNKSLNQRWRMKTENRHPLCSIFKFSGRLAFFHRVSARPSGSAPLAAPPVEQQSNRTSASRLENPPVSLDAFRGARPMDRWRYRQSYTRQRGIPSYQVVDPRLCKAAALLCDS